MLRLMLAADELYPNDLGKLCATGYLAQNYSCSIAISGWKRPSSMSARDFSG